nr:serine/threonine protein kinase [uncultured Desulfuromonas sp.]
MDEKSSLEKNQPFDGLTPDVVMDAVESLGFVCDCRVFALNSYENRVYQVGIEDRQPLVVKFYRPQRWSDAQILEEHQFCFELVEQELPVVAPWRDVNGQSLFFYQGHRLAVFERRGGHAPEFDDVDNLMILGRFLGRMHAVGSKIPFSTRPALDSYTFGYSRVALISEQFMPREYKATYETVTKELLHGVEAVFKRLSLTMIRTHGDCHAGNILWRDNRPHFVDFDDTRMAPAIQDIWMMLSGDRIRQQQQLQALMEGYDLFYPFPVAQLPAIEALRSLRMIHYASWLAERWHDPTFPAHFPWFNTMHYWGEHVLQLREQLAALNEPPLSVYC